MAFHVLQKRCDECGRINIFRRPKKPEDLIRILPLLPCHFCHPEALEDACGGCRYPLSVVGRHKKEGICPTCAIADWRHRSSLQKPAAP